MMTVYVVSLRCYGQRAKKGKTLPKSLHPFGVYTTLAKARKAGEGIIRLFGAGLVPRYISLREKPQITGDGGARWTLSGAWWHSPSTGEKRKDVLVSVDISAMPLETDETVAKATKTLWFRKDSAEHAAYCHAIGELRACDEHSDYAKVVRDIIAYDDERIREAHEAAGRGRRKTYLTKSY